MKEIGRRRSQVSRALLSLAPLALAVGCIKTDFLVDQFNSGAIDTSGGNVFHDPDKAEQEIAQRILKAEMIDAYFGQGSGYVASWLESAAADAETFRELVEQEACEQGYKPACAAMARRIERCALQSEAIDAAAPPSPSKQTLRQSIRDTTAAWSSPPPTKAICGKPGKTRDDDALRYFTDYIRFNAAVERAVRGVADVYIERLVDEDNLGIGASIAMSQTAAYMRARRWVRSLDRHTTGLVAKGGAATGIFSAGVVWVVLNLADQYSAYREARAKAAGASHAFDRHDVQFDLLSGTSTGALVSAAVALYCSQADPKVRRQYVDKLARWFTCYSLAGLYCVQSRPVLDLIRDQKGLVAFDGIQRLLESEIKPSSMNDHTELIFSTVDFRTGRLYALSDQDPTELLKPEHVVQAALASAVLPFIAEPVKRLPVNYDPNEDLTYLDGGIRSELPIMPLVRRGAERVLVVSSSASITGETKPLQNAATIAQRYIDIETGGTMENEIAFAPTRAQSVRLAEYDACVDWLDKNKQGKGPVVCAPPCDARAVCEGRWSDVCGGGAQPAPAPPTVVPGRIDASIDHVAELWQMKAIYRDEKHTQEAHGYDFQPALLRSLFEAGAEAARVRCLEIAGLLGIPTSDPHDPELRKRIVRWCTPVLPPDATLCAGVPAEDRSSEPRTCGSSAKGGAP